MGQWTAITRRCVVEKSKNLSASPDLLALLTRLATELKNYSFEGLVELKDPAFRSIESDWPEISQIICGVLQFRRDNRQTDWNYTNSTFH